jgi:hypothetical protein
MISSLCSPLFQCSKTEPSFPHQSPTYFVFGFLKRRGLSAYAPLNILDLASSTIEIVWPLHWVSGFDIPINATLMEEYTGRPATRETVESRLKEVVPVLKAAANGQV